MLEFFFWVLLVSVLTVFGAWYARKFGKADAIIGLYVVFILFSNLAASKISVFDFGFAQFFAPAVVVIFSVTFLITDIVNEKFGRKETQKMILIAFVSQIAMVFFFWLGVKFPPAPFWAIQETWGQIFNLVPRITLASWVAFLITENFDAFVFSWFRKLTKGKHLWTRNAFSSIPALLLDSLIFIPIAFFGVMPILPLIIGQTAVKWLVGLVNIPFMYLNKAILGKNEVEEKTI